ncbi:MAG: hypothetical protein GVY29_13305 [Spirochaetes bacterium]|jgi:hypothetical protein|nr:hypothetical protein [Spirochaetota bacterium]
MIDLEIPSIDLAPDLKLLVDQACANHAGNDYDWIRETESADRAFFFPVEAGTREDVEFDESRLDTVTYRQLRNLGRLRFILHRNALPERVQ